MNSTFEDKRSLLEERDRIELAIINEILAKKTSHRAKLGSEHRQKVLLDRYMKCSADLLTQYEKHPSDLLNVSNDPFKEFYTSLRHIKDFYTRNSDEQLVTLANEFDEIEVARQIALGLRQNKTPADSNKGQTQGQGYLNDHDYDDNSLDGRQSVCDDENQAHKEGEILRLTRGLPTTDLVSFADPEQTNQPAAILAKKEEEIEFTDEEGYGRYLDLIKCHEAYLQVIKRQETKPNYLTFLDNFDKFDNLDREFKLSMAYKTYVETLLEYFRDYSRRAKPLFDYKDLESQVEEKFQEQWDNKKLPGWFKETECSQTDTATESMIDLDSYKDWTELLEIGLDCLKKELQVKGLKCGGTLEERAKRLWSVRGKSLDEIEDSLKASVAVNKKGKKKPSIDARQIASIEAKIIAYADHYNDYRQATIENVQRKQSRTAEERNESGDDVSDDEDEDNDQSDVVYNPKNLPLGWDGKPIPYWLYKLHGLNLTFTCEICGNATYKGPKTFQRHFAEWRHAHGMRSLSIPNTAHFANITSIKDALDLWNKLKGERQRDKFQPLVEEEYEDSQGNVVNKKTYEDLKRQGLL